MMISQGTRGVVTMQSLVYFHTKRPRKYKNIYFVSIERKLYINSRLIFKNTQIVDFTMGLLKISYISIGNSANSEIASVLLQLER